MLANGHFFIKSSLDSNSGSGCAVLKNENGFDILSNSTIEQIFDSMRNNFSVQEPIRNSSSIAALHPEGVNTFRITIYIWSNIIEYFPVIMRIGRGSNALDNAHRGGMFIGVKEGGTLADCAYTEFQDDF